MRDLAGHMVRDMRLGDAMCSMGTKPAHQLAAIAHQVAIQGGQSTTGKRELGKAVMGDEGIGVLQECDQHQPVIDPVKWNS